MHRELALETEHIKREGDLTTSYEAEEEDRIVVMLSRKLEQLRESKTDPEATSKSTQGPAGTERRVAEVECRPQNQSTSSSSYGTSLRQQQPQQQEQTDLMLETMKRENDLLKTRLADMELDHVRVLRLNELYREELIECRRRLGLPVDDLIGLPSDAYSQYRSTSSSTGSSPSTSVFHSPTSYTARHHHPSGSSSAASAVSTNVTSPPSSFSLGAAPMMPTLGVTSRGLTYPSVPPPSLSSSYGSVVWDRDVGQYHSPVEGLSRRSSNAGQTSNNMMVGRWGSVGGAARVVEIGSVRASRRASGDMNYAAAPLDGRVRSRAGSVNQGMNLNLTQGYQLPEKVDEADGDDDEFLPK